jgi:cytochrome c2
VAARWCTACHATGTTAQAGDVGPTFEEIAARRSDDFLRGFLSNPHVRGSMPPFELAREHVADLVAYIRSLE